MKRLVNPLVPLLAALLATAACAPSREAAQAMRMPDKDEVWQLVALRGRELPADSAPVTLRLNPEAATLSGRMACNSYGAAYSLSPSGRLSVKGLAAGDVRCPEADMNAEVRYMALLGKADRAILSGTTLTLCQAERELLRFELLDAGAAY